MKCECGEKVTTKFCPNCGAKGLDPVSSGLIAHLKAGLKQSIIERERWKNADGSLGTGDRAMTRNNKTARYEAWLAWVEARADKE